MYGIRRSWNSHRSAKHIQRWFQTYSAAQSETGHIDWAQEKLHMPSQMTPAYVEQWKKERIEYLSSIEDVEIDSEILLKLKNSVSMPKTKFPNRSVSGAPSLESRQLIADRVYEWQEKTLPEESLFILHDGPPYANADVHLGHAVNRIVKDIIIRFKVMEGRRVSYIPGWDCHGLPIELKVLDNVRSSKENKGKQVKLSPIETRTLARKHADSVIQRHMENFRQWGTMGDWDNLYKTMNPQYELRQLEVFRAMVREGLIYRRDKPVYWSLQTQTALAEAELEYNGQHKNIAATIKFPIKNLGRLKEYPALESVSQIGAIIWTTAAWTVPANRALAVGPKIVYQVVHSSETGYLVLAQSRVDWLSELLGGVKFTSVVENIPAEILTSCEYINPMYDSAPAKIFLANFVSSESGSGIVHLAPGHGMDDYLVCQDHGIPPYSVANSVGKYDTSVPDELDFLIGQGCFTAGRDKVIEILIDSKSLVHVDRNYIHKYPYDWRSKKPVMIRSTAQWFANVGKIKDETIAAISDVQFIPDSGRSRLTSFVRDRSEWCISRQRAWGVPIPALYDSESGEALLTDDSVAHIIEEIKKVGIDSWFEEELDTSHWVAPEYRKDGVTYVKGSDTMDVWFDSGTSWTLMQKKFGKLRENRQSLVDIYIEGSDQHRGWFQSSLLTYTASNRNGKVPYGTLLTHGFTLDTEGQKMSKSLGNVAEPGAVAFKGYRGAPAVGVDGLRLWVAQSEYTTDISFSTMVIKRVVDLLSKIRRTFKYILGVLDQFSGTKVPYRELSPIDKFALYGLYNFEKTAKSAYSQHSFFKVVQATSNHLAHFSSTFLNSCKDSAYTDHLDSQRRRSVQTVFAYALRIYISVLSPILPFLTQEVWNYMPESMKNSETEFSPFVAGWFDAPEEWNNLKLASDFEAVGIISEELKLLLNTARENKIIGSSLDAVVYISVKDLAKFNTLLGEYVPSLAEFFVVSRVDVVDPLTAKALARGFEFSSDLLSLTSDGPEVKITISQPWLEKCPRCWQYHSESPSALCHRCEDVLAKH
ncbi:tRNA synthetases class I-domain-containing protein [Lipomyces oligophaga]|uniref:tRNA synthetases class I-domain-containing protein n=1 Tax=Lipomyces oligophaga TaxID=45792 RepID=UPI0034CD542C